MLACFEYGSPTDLLITAFAVLSGFVSGLLLMFYWQLNGEIRQVGLFIPPLEWDRYVYQPHPRWPDLAYWLYRRVRRSERLAPLLLATFAVGVIALTSSVVVLLLVSPFPLVHFGWLAGGAAIGAALEQTIVVAASF